MDTKVQGLLIHQRLEVSGVFWWPCLVSGLCFPLCCGFLSVMSMIMKMMAYLTLWECLCCQSPSTESPGAAPVCTLQGENGGTEVLCWLGEELGLKRTGFMLRLNWDYVYYVFVGDEVGLQQRLHRKCGFILFLFNSWSAALELECSTERWKSSSSTLSEGFYSPLLPLLFVKSYRKSRVDGANYGYR